MFHRTLVYGLAVCAGIGCVSWASVCSADVVGFEPTEGYTNATGLNGQPGSGSVWNTAGGASSSVFSTVYSSSEGNGYLVVQTAKESGSGYVTPEYATKRMAPVTGTFQAGFSVRYSYNAWAGTHQTAIALGQSADSGWGVYLGFNKTSNKSIAYHDGTDWVEICTGLDYGDGWFDVRVQGDVASGQYAVSVYLRNDTSATDPDAGLLGSATATFRDDPTALSYAMITNEGAARDSGAYSHSYDDLYLAVPEPATLSLLGIAAVAAIRRRRDRRATE